MNSHLSINTDLVMRRLRHTLLDEQRHSAPADMLDCAAHMLLYLDEPEQVHSIGLKHLLRTFDATRADLGFASPDSPEYTPTAIQLVPNSNALLSLERGLALPNLDPGIQIVWNANHPVFIDVAHDPVVDNIRPVMQEVLRIRTKLARRLEVDGQVFGLLCIDQTEESRVWSEHDHRYMEQFVTSFFAPILYNSLMVSPSQPPPENIHLTEAELEVVRLAATGLTYKEIAKRLQKSPNTVDNQLRLVRKRLGVRNQIELIQVCEPFL